MQVIRQLISTVPAGNVRFCNSRQCVFFVSKLICKIMCSFNQAKGGGEGGGGGGERRGSKGLEK